MGYEDLLEEAYENVEPCEECGRFEILNVEGHHAGSKTMITNFGQVANCLRRDANHLAKFLFRELATSGEVKGDRLVLDKKESSKRINEKIEKYARVYVFCPTCKKPDTELVEENGKVYIRCLACGERKEIHS